METQVDYETEATVAVLGSPAMTDVALERLRALGISDDAIHRNHPPPERFQCLDTTMGEGVNGLLRGTLVGAPIGAVLGVGAGALGGVTGATSIGLVSALWAAMGAIVGSIVGAAVGAHYDDDAAASIDLSKMPTAEVVSVLTHSHPETLRARQVLWRSGALALLDPNMVPAAWTSS